jgi:hypothetical protein
MLKYTVVAAENGNSQDNFDRTLLSLPPLDIPIVRANVLLSLAVTVDEHFQREGVEAFLKFQGSVHLRFTTLIFDPILHLTYISPPHRRIFRLDTEVRYAPLFILCHATR